MLRAKEPRGTLKPFWNIIPDGKITNYTPHTITFDTPTRKNTVIRKSDIAIATDTRTLERTIQDKPRLMEFDACKTVGEYIRNKEKIKKIFLDEQKTKDSEKQQRVDTQRVIEDTATNDEQPGPLHAGRKTKQKRAQRKTNTKSPITIVTSNSPKDFMTQTGPGKKSIDQIVQKIKNSNQDKQQVAQKPEGTNERVGTHIKTPNPQTSTASKEPTRKRTQ